MSHDHARKDLHSAAASIAAALIASPDESRTHLHAARVSVVDALDLLQQPTLPTCEACGAEGATQSPWSETLCPACTQRQAIDYAAEEHLRFLLRGALAQWHTTWKNHAATVRYAVNEAGIRAQEVMREIIDEDQRDRI